MKISCVLFYFSDFIQMIHQRLIALTNCVVHLLISPASLRPVLLSCLVNICYFRCPCPKQYYILPGPPSKSLSWNRSSACASPPPRPRSRSHPPPPGCLASSPNAYTAETGSLPCGLLGHQPAGRYGLSWPGQENG